MRTDFFIRGLLLAVALCALGAAPVLAELTDSPQVITASISPQGLDYYDPVLGEMMAQVGESEIYQSTYDLQNISTRIYPSSGNRQAAAYLYARLAAIPGLDVEYQNDGYQNIIASLPGKDTASDKVIIVGAHYDSTSPDPDHAPGATDNACGAAIVLELARVMSRYQFNNTIQFAFWNAEELGGLGSTGYVARASADSLDIPLYFNYDSSCYDPEDSYVLDVIYNAQSAPFAEELTRDNSLYGIDLHLTYNVQSWGGDHWSFWRAEYPAIATGSASPAPQAHTQRDTIDLVSSRYAKKNAQLGMGVLATTAGLRTRTPDSPVRLIAGGSGVPRDLNGDGLCEDVNGNGRIDFADVVLYFNQMTWISANEPVAAFDDNGNGRIDFADIVWLFQHL